METPFSDSSASNCSLFTKSRRTWSWRSVVQSSLIAPRMWLRSYAAVSSSTSIRTTWGLSRLSSTHWAVTSEFSRLMILSFVSVRCGVGGGAGGGASEKQVDLASEAEPEDRVEQCGRECETDSDGAHGRRSGDV